LRERQSLHAMLYLASVEAGHISGQTIVVDAAPRCPRPALRSSATGVE